jgi:hypothetical protein
MRALVTLRRMVKSAATSVDDYLAALPTDRRAAITAVRDIVNANLPDGYVELVQYGMISWSVPLSRFPDTYNGQPLAVASLASQKSYMALYLLGVYGDPELAAWFRAAYARTGKRLDMGASCVRFKTLDALPLELIGETIAKIPVDALLARYREVKAKPAKRPAKRAAAPAAKRAKRPAAKPSKPTAKRSKPATKGARRR